MTAELALGSKYTAAFREALERTSSAWLTELRSRAFDHFIRVGFPTVRDEDWKYTNVAPFIDGLPAAAEMRLPAEELDGSAARYLEQFDLRRNGFTALHMAFADIRVIRIAKDTRPDEPITLEIASPSAAMRAPHFVVVAEPGAEATIVELYRSDGDIFTNTGIQIFVGDNAHVTHFRVQEESDQAFHVGTTEVTVGRAAAYDSTNINVGGRLSRHDIHLKFEAEGGEAFVDGLYFLGGEQHHDTHSVIDHQVPNCISHQTYRGVLNDSSRGVFNGKLFVRENAHGTDAQQSNKNLLLSNDARVDTKPQLEIFNDDVKCSHGATVGQLEEEELFYLLTRGLPMPLARNLLTYGFAEEIINKIGVAAIKEELDRVVLNRLTDTGTL